MDKLTDTDIQRLHTVAHTLGLDQQDYDLVHALTVILEGRLWDVSHAERQEIDHIIQWAVHDAVDYEERMRAEGDHRPTAETADASITLKWCLERGREAFGESRPSPLQ